MVGGFVEVVFFVVVIYDIGVKGYLLVFVGVVDGVEGVLVNVVFEVLIFLGIEVGMLDVIFVLSEVLIVEMFVWVGLWFDLLKLE